VGLLQALLLTVVTILVMAGVVAGTLLIMARLEPDHPHRPR
jgi:hypothetical protein